MRQPSLEILTKVNRIKETTIPENITPRELINSFGFYRRTSGCVRTINTYLAENGLERNILILENNFPDGYYPDEAEGGKLTNENRNSIGALITYKNKTRVLVTGDMGEGDEYRISEKLSSKGINKIDVYKMGHHGATPAAYTPFLDYIEPTNVVIANTIDSVRPYGNENLRLNLSFFML